MNDKILPIYGVRSNPLFRPLWLALLVFLLSSMVVQAQTATVTSDKDDYAPRSNAVFTGAGFAPYENVTLKVKNLNRPCNTVSADSSYLPWTVKANASGGFVTNWTVCNCPGDSLRLKAVGQFSGSIAYAFFKDGNVGFGQIGVPGSNTDMSVNVTYTKPDNSIVTELVNFKSNGTTTIGAKDNTTISWVFNPVTVGGITYNWTGASNYTQGFNIGTSNYTGSSAIQGTFSSVASTNLSVSSATGIYGGTSTLTATLSSGTTSLSGKSINFSLNGTSVGTAITNASGVATLSNASLAGINAATYPTGVSASFTADATHSASTGNNSLTVNKKALTAATTVASKVYDGSAVTGTVTLGAVTGLVGSETLVITPTATNYADANAGTGKPTTVSYTLANGTGNAGNYSMADLVTSGNITGKALTITAAAKTKVYGTVADPELTYSAPGLVSGDVFTGSLSRASGNNVGTYAITSTLANSNYNIIYEGANFTITPLAITAFISASNKVYDGSDAASATGSATGVNNASVAVTVSNAKFNNANVGTAKAVTADVSISDNNYSLTSATAGTTANITAKPVTITAAAKSKVYGDADPALTYSITAGNLIGSDAFTGALTRNPGENVNTYAITQGSVALSSNYALTYTGADLTIGTRPVAITAAAKSKVYGEADPALTYSITAGNLIGSDAFTGALTRNPGENVNTYAITQGSVALSSNYALTYTGADLTIGQRAITITADAKGKTYGDIDPALTYTITAGNLIGSDAFTGALTRNPGENVNTYAITQGSVALSSNYALTYTGADLTIGTRPVAITAAAKSKVYGEADPALTYSITAGNLIGSDAFTGALTRNPGENVNTYAITQGSVALSSNYALTYTGADLTIGTRPVAITAAAKSKVYGEADPALTYSITAGNLIGSDAFTGALTRNPGENVNTYAITQGSVALSSNYALTYTGADLTIGTRPVAITAAAKSKVYGEADPALTYSITAGNLIGSDAFTGALTRNPGENVNTYAITQGSVALSSNYALTYTGADLTIGQRAITITADAKGKTYGDIDPALTYTITAGNLIGTDVFTGSLSRTAGENVNTYAIGQGDVTLGGNYYLSYVGANLTVGKLAVTLFAEAKNKVYGDVNPTLTFVSNPTVGTVLANGHSIGFTGSLNRATGENVGDYAIGQNTVANSNYAITYIPANLSITPLPVIVNAQAKTKVYGDADPALTFVSNPAVGSTRPNGEGISFTGALNRVEGESVGNYAIGQNTLANSNYTITYNTANFAITQGGGAITSVRDNNPTQYSDIVNVWARIAPNPNNALVVAGLQQGGSVTFRIKKGATGIPVLLGTTTQFNWDATNNRLEFTGNFKVNSAPDTYIIIAEYTPVNTNLNGCTNEAETLVVTREDADVTYNGAQYFSTGCTSCPNADVIFMAHVKDRNDNSSGDIRKGMLKFSEDASDLGIGLVNPADLTEGISSMSKSYSLNNSEMSAGGKTIELSTEVNNWYAGKTVEPTLITIAVPGGEFITGGGNVVLNQSAGLYAADPGTKMNFGFNMKWNNSGKNLLGQINVIFRRFEISDNKVHVYQIKSNAISSMSVATNGGYKKAVVATKANLRDITDPSKPISLGGNLNLTMDVWEKENSTNGTNDMIAISLSGGSSNNIFYFSSNWVSPNTTTKNLAGGKISVRSNFTQTPITSPRIAAPTPAPAQPVAAQFDSYPNPFSKAATFRFALEREQQYELAVYDIRGILIKKVSAGSAEAGKLYEFNLDGQYLSYGVYFARLITQDGVKTIRIVKE